MGERWDQIDVCVIVSDAESCIDLIHVVAVIKEHGFLALWIVDHAPGTQAGRILDRHGIPYEIRGHGPCIADNPTVLLIGCGTAAVEAQLIWTGWAQTRRATGGSVIPIYWREVSSGDSVHPSVMNSIPDVILVTSEFAAENVTSRRPGVRVVVAETAESVAREVMQYL